MKNFDGSSIDRRQRVNLSDEAFSLVKSDSFTFAGSGFISYSEMICRLFLMFAEQSAAKRQDLVRTAELLARKASKPSRAQQKTPSLQNGVLAYLSQSDVAAVINNKCFGGSPGKFIKAVIEEYAEMPFIEREKIYYKDIVDKINCNLNRRLRIVIGSQTLLVKPYQIIPDKQSAYNYLTCFSAKSNSPAPAQYSVASLRISRIKSVTVLPDSEFVFNDTDIDKMKQAITERGVPFLRDEVCDVIIELKDVGKSLFNAITFQRPEVRSVVGDIYNFRCTVTQAEIFFFRFGAEATVITPKELREKFKKRYNRAAEIYNDED